MKNYLSFSFLFNLQHLVISVPSLNFTPQNKPAPNNYNIHIAIILTSTFFKLVTSGAHGLYILSYVDSNNIPTIPHF
jgi:hypothetical protein